MHAKFHSVVISKSAVFSRLDDTSGVVLELNLKRYYMLSQTGAAIMEMLNEDVPITIHDIVESLIGDFDLDRATLERDVRHYLRELEGRKVVEMRPSFPRPPEPDASDSLDTAELQLDTAELQLDTAELQLDTAEFQRPI